MSNTNTKYKVLRAQEGTQTRFLSSPADVMVFGGGAGGGKTFAILLDVLRHINDPNYTAVIFRRTSVQLTAPGSLWQTAKQIWTLKGIDGVPREKDYTFIFPSGATVKFSHMELAQDRLNWSGSQLTAIYFDEAQLFEEEQVNFMFSRMRSDAQCSSYMRLTCNPRDCYLKKWISWWLDEDGFPIKERTAKLRYFVVRNDEFVWADSPEELAEIEQDPAVINEAMSFTFIPSLVTDNPAMVKSNPKYISFLKGLPRIQREALLDGNWNVSVDSGTYFKREWVAVEDRRPTAFKSIQLRYWDRAGTEVNEAYKNPDWTVGALMAKDYDGYTWIVNIIRFRATPFGVAQKIRETAQRDSKRTKVLLEQDPGQAGKSDVQSLIRELTTNGFDARARKVTKDKLTRFMPFSAAAEAGMVKVVRGDWNEAFFTELENYVGAKDSQGKKSMVKDDQVDAVSGGFNELNEGVQLPDAFTIGSFSKSNTFSF